CAQGQLSFPSAKGVSKPPLFKTPVQPPCSKPPCSKPWAPGYRLPWINARERSENVAADSIPAPEAAHNVELGRGEGNVSFHQACTHDRRRHRGRRCLCTGRYAAEGRRGRRRGRDRRLAGLHRARRERQGL